MFAPIPPEIVTVALPVPEFVIVPTGFTDTVEMVITEVEFV